MVGKQDFGLESEEMSYKQIDRTVPTPNLSTLFQCSAPVKGVPWSQIVELLSSLQLTMTPIHGPLILFFGLFWSLSKFISQM